MIKGFVGAIRSFQVRGWTYDPERPGERLTVELCVGDKLIASAKADLLRPDLRDLGHGDGRSGFVINAEGRLPLDEPDSIQVRAVNGEGQSLVLPRIAGVQIGESKPSVSENVIPSQPLMNGSKAKAQLAQFPGQFVDRAQHPVFILGAARSGTSAMLQALSKSTRYAGFGEGHLLDVLRPLLLGVSAHYRGRSGEWKQGRSTLIADVSEDFFLQGLGHIFVELARQTFPDGWWLDKTPRPEMIACAPLFRKIWPESRFIFMKRRAIENVASRTRKFTGTLFEEQCRDWARSMQCWAAVRGELAGVAIEIDQLFLAQNSDRVATELAPFLLLSNDEQSRLAEALASDQPERTSERFASTMAIEEMDWDSQQRNTFMALCGPVMQDFGYDPGRHYYSAGQEASAFVRV